MSVPKAGIGRRGKGRSEVVPSWGTWLLSLHLALAVWWCCEFQHIGSATLGLPVMMMMDGGNRW